MTTLEIDIPSRICVRPPYFAFPDLTTPEVGTAQATVPVEAPPAGTDPISLAEITRHGAILGLCAVATHADNDDRRYYLAVGGTVTWTSSPEHRATVTGPIHGHSVGKLVNKRRGSAKTFLTTASGDPLARLTVDFGIFSEPAFKRMFARTARPDLNYTPPTESPYSQPLDLTGYQANDNGTTAEATVTATPEQCAGHFEGHPALPVAVTVRACFDLADRLANTSTPGRWEIHDGQMHPISQLIPAGQPVTLHAEIVHTTPTARLIRVDLASNGEHFGHLTIHLNRA